MSANALLVLLLALACLVTAVQWPPQRDGSPGSRSVTRW
jgi:hypothetical protein